MYALELRRQCRESAFVLFCFLSLQAMFEEEGGTLRSAGAVGWKEMEGGWEGRSE